MTRSLVILLLLGAGLCARAQDPTPPARGSVFWEDPRLEEAVRGADLIVSAEVSAVAADGATFKVLKTIAGPARDGASLTVSGLHHPDLRERPPVEPGDQAYLLLLGDPQGTSLHVPTPSFGRFPIKSFGPRRMVIASLGDTFTRLPLEPARFEQLIGALRGGPADELLAWARADLAREDVDPTTAYGALRLIAYFGGAEDAPAALKLLARDDMGVDERWVVRMSAADALGRAGTPEAVQRLLLLLTKDPVPAVRSAAARALGPAVSTLEDQALRRQAIQDLAAAALEADAEAITPLDPEDPRTNEIDSPLMACLRALAGQEGNPGVRPALHALEQVDLGAVVAGLTYFEALGERAWVGEIANRMRLPGAEDELVNRIFARTLQALTGQALGTDRARWMQWWSTQGPVRPQGPAAPDQGGDRR